MDFARTCGAFIVIYLQFSFKEAVEDYVKLCDKLNKTPALTIFHSGVLSNIGTGFINLASQSGEESQCTITPVYTNSSDAIMLLSFVESSETYSMSICLDQAQQECVKDTFTLVSDMESPKTLYYRSDALYARQAACLMIHVVDGAVNVICYDQHKNNSAAVKPNSDNNPAVPVLAAVASVLGCLLIVTTVLLVKYKKSKLENRTGDLETENPLYNADEKTGTDSRDLATLATNETHNTQASMKENEKVKNDTVEGSGNRVNNMILTRSDLAENTEYNEIMQLAVMNDTNNATSEDDPTTNDYSIIHEENGQDEIDTSGKARGCSDTYYSQIEIHDEDNKTVEDLATRAIRSGPASMNPYAMCTAQQVESEQDSEYHHINGTVITTPLNEYDIIRRQVSKTDCTRDSTYNHV